MIKKCEYCSTEFTPGKRQENTKRFCSTNCGRKYSRKIGNPEKHKETERLYKERVKNTPELMERRKESFKKYWQTPKGRFCHYKAGAVSRDLEFTLSFEEFMSFWGEQCHYCGDEIDGIGIDRIDNNIGYHIDNCAPCCATCNNMKKTMIEEDFINQCAKIINNINTGEC